MEELLTAITALDDDAMPLSDNMLAALGYAQPATVAVEPLDVLERRVLDCGSSIARAMELHPGKRSRSGGTEAAVPFGAADYVGLRFRLREAREVREDHFAATHKET